MWYVVKSTRQEMTRCWSLYQSWTKEVGNESRDQAQADQIGKALQQLQGQGGGNVGALAAASGGQSTGGQMVQMVQTRVQTSGSQPSGQQTRPSSVQEGVSGAAVSATGEPARQASVPDESDARGKGDQHKGSGKAALGLVPPTTVPKIDKTFRPTPELAAHIASSSSPANSQPPTPASENAGAPRKRKTEEDVNGPVVAKVKAKGKAKAKKKAKNSDGSEPGDLDDEPATPVELTPAEHADLDLRKIEAIGSTHVTILYIRPRLTRYSHHVLILFACWSCVCVCAR